VGERTLTTTREEGRGDQQSLVNWLTKYEVRREERKGVDEQV
jgi:hypothetical protein